MDTMMRKVFLYRPFDVTPQDLRCGYGHQLAAAIFDWGEGDRGSLHRIYLWCDIIIYLTQLLATWELQDKINIFRHTFLHSNYLWRWHKHIRWNCRIIATSGQHVATANLTQNTYENAKTTPHVVVADHPMTKHAQKETRTRSRPVDSTQHSFTIKFA